MADRFATCLALVLQLEGGYADNPADPGGATNMGITRKTLAAWRHISPWTDLRKTEVKNLDRGEAARIYRANYWDVIWGKDLPAGVDLALFDFAVNSGPDRAVKMLQRLLDVEVDGIVGPQTLAALRARRDVVDLINKLCANRLDFLRDLSTFATFGAGWTRRINTVQTAALADISHAPINFPSTNLWSTLMAFFSGYKTYIVAAIMVLAGVAQILGIDVPAMDGNSAGQLIMQALAMIFLRHGIKNTASGGA
ncbi:glycoside hydrolase family 108 protein [Devosia rhodophyticola]|uniref:Glycoside hydrolase family 108 protein n=1 Tax=Devosia rhodophyticola TaxID=3026423 RepID=A0ABY7YYR3_9HYPH|nr:glycoside hydrolase family 108 protein [Devosia rhodophyticola]WDR06391.1 glycoside hydrolase family 108 protein [Devosia rhodophyticola]